MKLELDTFKNIDDVLKSEIVSSATIVPFEKGDTIFEYYNTPEYFFIIVDGKIKISQMSLKNNKEQTIYMLSKGDMYDTITLLDGKVHEVLSEVMEAGLALRIPIEKAREWMYDFPIFGEMILKYVANQLRKTEELASSLTLLDTKERLIKLLMENLGEEGNQKNILDGLSNAEIGNLIGTVRHVVDRHLKQLKSDGVLENSRKKLSLKDKEKLFDLSLD